MYLKCYNIIYVTANIDPGRRYLYLYIKTGRAFLEHIDDNDGTPGQVASYFTFHIHFRGQRFKSRPIACACEPDIDEGFLLELHKDGAGNSVFIPTSSTSHFHLLPLHLLPISSNVLIFTK